MDVDMKQQSDSHESTPEAISLADFYTWSGMDEVYPAIQAGVGWDGDSFSGRANGWAVLALTSGLGATVERLRNRLDTFSLICGLLLSASIGLVAEHPDSVKKELDDSGMYKALLCLFMFTSIMCHFTCIILGTLYTGNLGAAARSADQWRLILANGSLPGLVDVFFTIGNITLTATIAAVLYPEFGLNAAFAFFAVVVLVCGIGMHMYNAFKLKGIGHPIHSWKRARPEEFEFWIPLKEWKRRADLDRLWRSRLEKNKRV